MFREATLPNGGIRSRRSAVAATVWGALVGLTIGRAAHAEEGTLPIHASGDRSPLLVILESSPEFRALGTQRSGLALGVVESLAARSVARHVATETAALRSKLPGLDVDQIIRDAYRCLVRTGVERVCENGIEVTSTEKIDEHVVQAITTSPAYVLQLSLRYRSATMMIVARWRELQRDDQGRFPAIRYVDAAYVTRAPADLVKSAKSAPAMLDQYWSEGTPPRLDAEVKTGLHELADLLAAGIAESDKRASESLWKEYPEIRSLQDSGRIVCRGLGGGGCGKAKLLKDAGERIWFGSRVINGIEVVSLNSDAAKYNSGTTWAWGLPLID
jgi:hypothetical protein